jgi:hypothetical protein
MPGSKGFGTPHSKDSDLRKAFLLRISWHKRFYSLFLMAKAVKGSKKVSYLGGMAIYLWQDDFKEST